MTAPCKDCPDRNQGCHSACPKYIAFRAERDKVAEIRRRNIDLYKPRNYWNPSRRERYPQAAAGGSRLLPACSFITSLIRRPLPPYTFTAAERLREPVEAPW